MSMVIEENIMVPMRDGVKLATDVYRPAQEGRWPVLVTRVPYSKDLRFPVPQLQEKRIFLVQHHCYRCAILQLNGCAVRESVL